MSKTMSDLIKRANEALQGRHPSEPLGKLIADMKAEIERLSKPYVPMTEDDWRDHWENNTYKGLELETAVETAVIARYNEQRGVK